MEETRISKKQIVTIILGILLTVISFCSYFLFDFNWLNILCGAGCFIYTIFLLYFQLVDKEEFTKKQRVIYPTVLLTVFYGVLILLVASINPLGKFCFDYILFTLFCGASIIPAFYLLLFIIASFAP